jgi:hypothetical protein
VKLARNQGRLFTPTWTPFNSVATKLVDEILEAAGITESRPKIRLRYQVVVASLLAQTAHIALNDKPVLSVPKTAKAWENYDVGLTVISQVVGALEELGHLTHLPISGRQHQYKDHKGKIRFIGIVSQYNVNQSLIDLEGFWDATWIETHRPTVLVSIPETENARQKRKARGYKAKALRPSVVKKTFKKDYTSILSGVNLLGSYWQQHPLRLPPIYEEHMTYAASAYRRYHNGKIDCGGRYYGAWSGINSNQRLLCTIDDEPVIEVDLNASQPTLFSSLMGQTMEVGNTWDDLYGEILGGFSIADSKDTFKARRNKLKQVAVELIGTGNVNKTHPAPESRVNWKDQHEFDLYRLALLYYVPALNKLEKMQDGYLNGAGFISYHEAEIMQHTLLALKDQGVPAYPIHDCCLVKKSDQTKAVETYRSVIREYVLAHNRLNKTEAIDITVPVSIEEAGLEKVKVAGSYNLS